LNICSHNS